MVFNRAWWWISFFLWGLGDVYVQICTQLDLITKNRYPVGNNLICTVLCADLIRFISILESWTLCRGTCAVNLFGCEEPRNISQTRIWNHHLVRCGREFTVFFWMFGLGISNDPIVGSKGTLRPTPPENFPEICWDLWIFWISLLDRLSRCEVAWNCKFWGFENWWWAQYLVSNLHELSRVYQILNRYETWTRSAANPLHWVVAGLFSCLVLELSTYNAMLRSYHHYHVIRFGGCHLQRSDYNKYWVDEDHSGAPKIAKLVYD